MWLRMVHPEDRPPVEAQSDAFLAGEGGDLDDYRMVRPDGRVVWVRDRAYAHRDDDGRVVWEHGILFDVTELKDAEARVAHMAFHDGLTGLANRQLFEETLISPSSARSGRDARGGPVPRPRQLQARERLARPPCGRPAARRARRTPPRCTRDTDLVARQGGDEFLMLLADLDPDEAASRPIRRSPTAWTRPRRAFDCTGPSSTPAARSGSASTRRTRTTRVAAEATPTSRCTAPSGSIPAATRSSPPTPTTPMDRLSFATRLRQAVEDESWVLHFQPVVDLADRRSWVPRR